MMKRKMFTLLLMFSMGTSAVLAQKGVEDGSRYGHGQDSIRCIQNISIYSEYVKTGNMKDAYPAWKLVFEEAPLAQVSTYTNGAKILRQFIEEATDPAKKQAFLTELMAVYDQRLKYLDKLNTLVRTPSTPGNIKGLKAHDYLTYSGASLDLKKAYEMLKDAIATDDNNAEAYILQDLMDVSSKLYKTDAAHKEAFIKDYLLAAGIAEKAYENETNEKRKEMMAGAKQNVEAYFISSGAASCEDLQNIYAPQIEENKTNEVFLKQVIEIMQLLNCTEQEAYFAASEYMHTIKPTAASATGCAYRYYKRGDLNKALDYFNEAINLETNNNKKADNAYAVAVILMKQKSYSSARQFAQKAISFVPSYGKAYILIAQMYAATPNWSDDPIKNKCTYYAAIDQLQRAKNADPSISAEANRLIAQYSAYTPKKEDLFFVGMKEGTSVTIGGWIGVTTTIR